MTKVSFLIVGLILSINIARAQQKYWIYFKDSVEINRSSKETSAPLNTTLYVKDFEKIGVKPIVHSKWLNAVSVLLDEAQKRRIEEYDFVSDIVKIDQRIKVMSSVTALPANFTKALRQIEADTLIRMHLNGKGVKIGIIDGGFLEADEDRFLNAIINDDRVMAYRNFIEKDITDAYTGSRENSDNHGTQVWRAVGGKDNRNLYRGLATEADYYLARTDQGDKEYRGEEDYWVAALEWMYDQGVRLVNSSVGYSTGYDDPNQDYSQSQVDGKSSAITRVATIAAKEKGMIIVIAGGNDGNNDFEIISVPADADGVLSVGASGFRQWNKVGYSSIGPEHLEDVKPEVACHSFNGTSFSAPIITGLAACIWQAYPDLTNQQVVNYIKQSAHLYNVPNNYLGYGVPNAKRILRLINGKKDQIKFEQRRSSEDTISIRFSNETNIIAFHKKNGKVVIRQEIVKPRKDVAVIRRIEGAKRTTVATPDRVVEIFWN